MKIAALDFGTNTFLCLLAEGHDGKITRIEKDLSQVVRLGQDVQKTAMFHPEALLRAETCMAQFSKEIKEFKADKILAVATSAARDVKNGHLLFELGLKYNIPIEIIAGQEEATTSFAGATFGLEENADQLLVVDIGGGSTELIVGQVLGHKINFAESIDVGAVRLTEKQITQQPIHLEEQKSIFRQIDDNLKVALEKVDSFKIKKAVAVAGTPTSIAAIELGGFDEKKVDGYYLSAQTLHKWQQTFASTSVQEKIEKFQLGSRADIIYAGTSILTYILKTLHLPGVFVSTKGVRYGVALKIIKS